MAASDITGLDCQLTMGFELTVSKDVTGLVNDQTLDDTYRPGPFAWSFGDGEGEADGVLFAYGQIAPSGVVTFDLFNVQNDDTLANFNQGFAFQTIKFVMVELLPNSSGGASGIRVGGGSWDGWLSAGGTHDVEEGGPPYLAGSDAGKPVTAAVRTLQITNLDASAEATVRLTVLGVKAPA